MNPASQGIQKTTTTGSIKRPNRRITARIACRLSVSYAAIPGEWRPATAMDLSRLGCRLRTGEDLPRDKKVSVRVEFRMADEPVYQIGDVAEAVGVEVARSLIGLAVQKLGGDVQRARELLTEEEIRLANLAADAIERERFGGGP